MDRETPRIDGDDVLESAARWLDAGGRLALATVIQTWRSSPRPVGSRLVVDDRGRFEGSVSGGCVEAAVVEEARDFLATGRSRTVTYGVTDETAWSVGLPCGGEVRILVGPLDRTTVSRLQAARTRRESVLFTAALADGVPAVHDFAALPGGIPARVADFAREARQGEAAVVEDGSARHFVQRIGPPLRLVVVGAVHVAQVLAPMAALAGYQVVIVDPRRDFARPERFPGTDVRDAWPEEALASLGLDADTAVVALAHDPRLDDPALHAALASDCCYIGALGGRRNQARRRQRLIAAGHDESALARIHGPVGLDIGAATAPEIAISILAQIVAVWRGTRRRPVGGGGGVTPDKVAP